MQPIPGGILSTQTGMKFMLVTTNLLALYKRKMPGMQALIVISRT